MPPPGRRGSRATDMTAAAPPPSEFSGASVNPNMMPASAEAAASCLPSSASLVMPTQQSSAVFSSYGAGSFSQQSDPSPVVGLVAAQHASTALFESSPRRRFDGMPHYVAAYADEIAQHLLDRELTVQRNGGYLEQQTEVTEKMRCILVDWLVDVAVRFRLHPETFFEAVDVVDRYLMTEAVGRATLQLVGIVAVLISAKMNEIYPPEVRECVFITANTYQRDEILTMERAISGALAFRFTVPTQYHFTKHLLVAVNAADTTSHLANYYCELSALCYGMLQFRQSRVGFASVLLAIATETTANCQAQDVPVPDFETLVATNWTEHHARAAGFPDIGEVRAAAVQLLRFVQSTVTEGHVNHNRYRAISRKYAHAQFLEVSARFAFPASI